MEDITIISLAIRVDIEVEIKLEEAEVAPEEVSLIAISTNLAIVTPLMEEDTEEEEVIKATRITATLMGNRLHIIQNLMHSMMESRS